MPSVTNQYKIKSICRGSWIKDFGEYDVITESGKDTLIKDPSGNTVFTTKISDPVSAVQYYLSYAYPFNKRPHLDSGKVVKFFTLGDSTDYTFTIVPTPSDATVIINEEERTSLTADKGTAISWSVSKEGYNSQSGTYTLNDNHTENVTLIAKVQYYAWKDSSENIVYTTDAAPTTESKVYTYSDSQMTESSDTVVSYDSGTSKLTVSISGVNTEFDRDSDDDMSL